MEGGFASVCATSKMSLQRNTTSAPGPADFASTSTSSQFRTQAGFARRDAKINIFERFAMGRSDSTFNALAGAAGGFMSGVVTCPLDVIKTKLQAQGAFKAQPGASAVYHGMLGTARVIWREEGLRGMYRGLGPIILGYLPTWAVWFTVYGKSKEYFSNFSGKLQTKILTGHGLNHHLENPNIVNFYSSIVAGATSTLVTNPIWVIKTRLMAQVSRRSSAANARPPWHYNSTLDAARKMYRTEGILSFYSGLSPALLGLTHVAVQFPAYEYLKTKFTGEGMGIKGDVDNRSHWFGILSASILSKILASSATYPHEVIRTRLQTQQRVIPGNSLEYSTFRGGLEDTILSSEILKTDGKPRSPKYKGILTTFNTILREEGWRAFYAGMGTNMMRAVPAATTTMLTYEYVMSNLRYLQDEGNRKEAALLS